MPVADPTVALEALVLSHVPPGVTLESVVVCPAHTLAVPVMAAGVAFTVISFVAVATPHADVIV